MPEQWKELFGGMTDEEQARFARELDEHYIPRAEADAVQQELEQRDARIAELEGQVSQIRLDAAMETALIKAGARNVRAARALLDTEALAAAEDALPLLEEQIAAMKESDGYLFEQENAGVLARSNFARKSAVPDESGLTYSQAMRLRKGILN